MASGLSSPNRRFDPSKRNANSTSLVKGAANRESTLWRAAYLMLGVTALMAVCVVRLGQLQIAQGQHFHEVAEQNRIRPIPLFAERGNIVDRSGKQLATNRLSRGVYLWPRQQPAQQWQATIDRLSPLIDVPKADILKRLEQAGYNSPLPVRVSQQITPAMFVKLAEQSADLPGVEVFAGSTRSYPQGSLAAHVLGYIGEATEADIKANPDYPNGMIVGQMGIERLANDRLAGKWGNRLVEVDAGGQETRLLNVIPAQSGQDVKLTLDLDLQKAAEKALNGRRGAAVVLDVKTGEVLALASGPTFDPTVFTRRVTEKDWAQFQQGDEPFLNRALQTYPPGSTFKIVTAAAGMKSGKYSPSSMLMTSAFISLGGHQFWEHGNAGYGLIGFREAFAVSSNTFFYQIGLSVGPEQIAKWGKVLGIGTTTLGLEGESHGLMPTPAEKEKLYGEPWYGGDTVSMSIGQGVVQVTPMELAVMVAAIANGGKRVKPHLLLSQTNQPEMRPEATGIDPEVIKIIQSGLVAVVQQGTGQRLNDGSIPLTAGKTGTSEVLGQTSHALFVGYAPANDPKIAVAVVVENGGYGGVAAIPVAHEVYKTYFAKQKAQTPQSKPTETTAQP